MRTEQWSMAVQRIPLIENSTRSRRYAMSVFRLKTTECKVGVVGLYTSGKTVLLTSLINHLQDHDPDGFPLGSKETRVRTFVVRAPDPNWSAFNYSGHREALVNHGRWPAKTTDRAQFVCQFE